MVMVALVFFTAGAIVCALANDFTVLLIGRSIQGVGGGGIVALTYVIVTDLVRLRDRGKWFGLISMMWAIGSVSGYVTLTSSNLLLLNSSLKPRRWWSPSRESFLGAYRLSLRTHWARADNT